MNSKYMKNKTKSNNLTNSKTQQIIKRELKFQNLTNICWVNKNHLHCRQCITFAFDNKLRNTK